MTQAMARDARGEDGLTREEIAGGLRGLGLNSGDVVLVHSAMRTFGLTVSLNSPRWISKWPLLMKRGLWGSLRV